MEDVMSDVEVEEDREDGELEENSQGATNEEDVQQKQRKRSDVPPRAPTKPGPTAKVALERIQTWPDWAEEGHPLHGFPPALQSLWKNSKAFTRTIQDDPEVSQIFEVSHGIDEDVLYPEGVPFTDEMKEKVQRCCVRIGYKPHYVQWKMQFDASKSALPQLALKFKWLSKPRIVVVQPKIVREESICPLLSDFLMRADYVIKSLWRCDTGYDFPNETSKSIVMQEFQTSTFIDLSAIFGFPFKWAQHFLAFIEKDEEVSSLPFRRFLKAVLNCFHHLISTWDETRTTELQILSKFVPYYQFHPWCGVEPRSFRKTFRGLCENRIEDSVLKYPGRLFMASIECPEFSIFVGAILYKKFPVVLPCFLVCFKRKSSLEENNVSGDILEIINGDINSDILCNATSSTAELSVHVVQMINLIYHIDDLFLRKPIPHFPKCQDSPVKTESKKETPLTSASGPSKKRVRDDKTTGSVSFRRRFSKASRKLQNQSATSTKVGPCASGSQGLPISIQLQQPLNASQGLLVAFPSPSPDDSDEANMSFEDLLICPEVIVDERDRKTEQGNRSPVRSEISDGDDNVFYSPNYHRSDTSPIIDENNVFFGTSASESSPPPSAMIIVGIHNNNAETEAACITPDSLLSPSIPTDSCTTNEFPVNMEVAEQVVVSFEGEVIDSVQSITGTEKDTDV